eukprot:TRINITY_DN70878_c0_g1_i1.p1 TRINITY_DN70878_c0_g1~~TRINITY_DN70878_c0_g1_i1.p1  ORF type:complete len:188 (+),score=35.39 TRINITY_DN70878_c0_g1_i1:38-565(+)
MTAASDSNASVASGPCSPRNIGQPIRAKTEKRISQTTFPASRGDRVGPDELRNLRAEVARLQDDAQRESRQRELLVNKIGALKKDLRITLDDNRVLADLLDERRRSCVGASAKKTAFKQETAFDTARELFKRMLADDAAAEAAKSASVSKTSSGGYLSREFRNRLSTDPYIHDAL